MSLCEADMSGKRALTNPNLGSTFQISWGGSNFFKVRPPPDKSGGVEKNFFDPPQRKWGGSNFFDPPEKKWGGSNFPGEKPQKNFSRASRAKSHVRYGCLPHCLFS